MRVDPTDSPQAAFAHRLRSRRLAIGLSMAEVARRSGCSASILGEYERAERGPRDEAFVRDLAAVLEVPADMLVADWRLTRPEPVSRVPAASIAAHQDVRPRRHVRRIPIAIGGGVVVGIGILVLALAGGTSAVPDQDTTTRTPAAHAAPPTPVASPSTAATPAIAVAATGPSITVTATSGLHDLDQIAVTGNGYTPSGNNVWIGQCLGRPGPAPVCDRETAHQVLQQVDADGKFSRSITMHETFLGSPAANPDQLVRVDCRVAPGCFISAGQANPNLASFQVISFG